MKLHLHFVFPSDKQPALQKHMFNVGHLVEAGFHLDFFRSFVALSTTKSPFFCYCPSGVSTSAVVSNLLQVTDHLNEAQVGV